ncbi:uncharacterized protein LOC114746765 [Neltuma alba]|uniref:uncharacterized protein LOC114733578 n=1 Tax=Neltuma alba TaxID=207710 RepID=UPI0010A54B52|nr:uncharacterized protein LOC114733578 [Prosopis alba]XP_028790879.1 uncharacterized protein LOC114746765 [Prosopis alba]
MEIWSKMVFGMRRVWLALYARLRARKNGRGLLKLQDEVQTCGYQDIQVMWEMLHRAESDLLQNHDKRKQNPSWSVLVWSNQTQASSESTNHTQV